MGDKEIIEAVMSEDDTNNTTEEVGTNETTTEVEQKQETETPAESPAPVEQTQTQTQTPVNDLSELDKARYSFQRQLGKQKSRYESQIAEYKKKFEALEKRLNGIENPEKPLLREQFESDDKFIDGLVQQRFDKMWEAKQAEIQEQYEKYLEEYKQEEEHKRELDEGINHWFPTQEERKKYVDTVQNAFSAGLAELLEQEQNVLSYLHQTENSSIILYEFATNPKVVNEIFQVKNPLMRLMAVRDLEMKLVNSKNTTPAPAPQPVEHTAQTNPAPAPVNNLSKPIGKPGAIVEAEPDIFSNEDELTRFVRSH